MRTIVIFFVLALLFATLYSIVTPKNKPDYTLELLKNGRVEIKTSTETIETTLDSVPVVIKNDNI